MKKIIDKIDEQSIKLYTKFSSTKFSPTKFKKGEGVLVWVLAAAIGTIILIGFYVIAKGGLGTWGTAFKKLVQI